MNILKEIDFGTITSYAYGVDAYDSTKLGLGRLIFQKYGVNKIDNYVAPPSIAIRSPLEVFLRGIKV
jgi:hypothetical protein